MDDKNNFLEKVPILITIATTYSLIFGVIKLLFYYHYFNLNIFSYLEFDEILPQILKSLVYVISIMVIGYLLGLLFNRKSYFETVRANVQQARVAINMFQRLRFYAKAYPIVTGYTFGIILNLIMFIIGKTNFPKFISESIIYTVCIAALILPIEINRKYVIIYNKPLDRTIYLLIDYAVVIFGFAAWQGLNDYHNTRYYHTTKDNIIFICEKKIVSTTTYYLIGKTKKYLFFYDEKKELTTIYPNTGVTEMIIKNDTY